MENEKTIPTPSSYEEESSRHEPHHESLLPSNSKSDGERMMDRAATTISTIAVDNGTSGATSIRRSVSSSSTLVTSKKRSSFLILNEESKRSIPQVRLTLENLTYRPTTSTAKAKLQRNSGSHVWNRLRKNKDADGDGVNGPSSGKERTVVLDKINTEISPFQLTAWMG
jgi:hypothetical protein